jgi:uncharacterized membrane protein YphA (DoxX/SURF4 family)
MVLSEAAFLIRIILGLLFAFASIMKIIDLKGFYLIFLQYGIVKGRLAKPSAYMLTFGELIIGISLLLNWQIKIFSGLALLSMLVSTYGLIHIYLNKKKLENCGCFGTAIKVPVNKRKITENIIWTVLALYLFLFNLLV